MSDSPAIVDQDGSVLEGPAMDAVLNRVSNMAVLANLARMRKSTEAIEKILDGNRYDGEVLEVILNCQASHQTLLITDNNTILKEPTPPWAVATFINDGPNNAFVLINSGQLPFQVRLGEVHPVDFTQARNKRIFRIDYWSNVGETASIRVKGKY